MRFNNVALQNALHAWRDDPDMLERAMADNVWFEERVSPVRLARFEALITAANASATLPNRQAWYWKKYVRTGGSTPHTFDPDLDPALLGLGPLEPFQPIVRLEDLRRPLLDHGLMLEDLRTAQVDKIRPS